MPKRQHLARYRARSASSRSCTAGESEAMSIFKENVGAMFGIKADHAMRCGETIAPRSSAGWSR